MKEREAYLKKVFVNDNINGNTYCLKVTSEDWCPSYIMKRFQWEDDVPLVKVKLHNWASTDKGQHRAKVIVSGNDDCYFEMWFFNRNDARDMFDTVVAMPCVDQKPLLDMGFMHG